MTILNTDLKFYYSGTSSKNGPGGPQGGVISSVQVPVQNLSGGLAIDNTLFEDVSETESANGKTQYVCIYLKNTNATQTATVVKIWQSSITPGQDVIRMGYSGVAANGHDPLLTETNTPIYRVPLSTSESNLNHTYERAAFYVSSIFAPIFLKKITVVEVYLKRYGSPTGTLRVRQRTRTSESIKVDFGSLDVSTINNSVHTLYQFTAPGNTTSIGFESVISVEYENGTENNKITVARKAGSPIPFMHVLNYDGSQWRSVSDFDLCGNMYTAGTAGDQITPVGVNFENPVSYETAITLPNLAPGAFVPIWLKREVPRNCPNQTNNTSEIAVRVLSPTP